MARKYPPRLTYDDMVEAYTGPTDEAVYKGQKRKKTGTKKTKPTAVKTQDSKAIKEIAYWRDKDHSVLYIQFNSNPSIFYRYDNVWETDIQGLLDAKSKGRYFQQNIRNRYKGAKKITVAAMRTLVAGGHVTVILDTSNEEQYLQDHLEGLN